MPEPFFANLSQIPSDSSPCSSSQASRSAGVVKKRTGCSAFATSAAGAEEALRGEASDRLGDRINALALVFASLFVSHGLADDQAADEADRLGRKGAADAAGKRRAGPLVVPAKRARREDLRDRERRRDAVPRIASAVDDVGARG